MPIWTINRIIKRNHLVKKPEIFEKLHKAYPYVQLDAPNSLHQFDIVGPRYLHKGNKIFSLHLIDVFSNMVKVKAYPGKRNLFVAEALVAAWQGLGIPKHLQLLVTFQKWTKLG